MYITPNKGIPVKKIILPLMLFTALSACGERVEVKPATEGYILGSNGYKPDAIPPSRFRLDPCILVCDKLILVEKSDQGMKEEFRLFMPIDQLNVTFDLRMTASIEDGATKKILNKITPTDNRITLNQVYETYAQPIIREVTRSVLAEYSINELSSSRDAVNAVLSEKLREALKVQPIKLKTVGLADIQFPDVITKQKEAAAERRIAIEREEAEKQIKLIQLQTEFETAKVERSIRRERAEALAEENKIAADSVTPQYLQYKKLEVISELAKNGSTSVFVPFDALDEVGLSQKVFK